MLITQGPDGVDLCLRPEYTIPVARVYLGRDDIGAPADYTYAGPVFRRRANETGEFLQAGIEMVGHNDIAHCDAQVLAQTLEAFTALDLKPPKILMGDIALLHALLKTLDVAENLQRRLMRAIVEGKGLQALQQVSQPSEETDERYLGLLAAMEGQDPQAARALVEDLLAIAGITPVGGRSIADIADRFLDKAAQKNVGLSADVASIISQFLSIKGDPDTASGEIRYLANNAGLDMDEAIDIFESRCGYMAIKGVNVGNVVYAGNFARNLNYYTGFVFELHSHNRSDGKPLGGGGRYDHLMSALGAPLPLGSVGGSLWIDRLADEVLMKQQKDKEMADAHQRL
jgi:ATP phosphoribosyltransferase regulatory subunit